MFKTIALALDGSEGSRRAIPVAAGLAQRDHAKIVVVHVEEDVARVGGPVDLDEPEIQAVVREQAKELSDQGIETSVVMAKTMISGPALVTVPSTLRGLPGPGLRATTAADGLKAAPRLMQPRRRLGRQCDSRCAGAGSPR
jgi:hypothetical protein